MLKKLIAFCILLMLLGISTLQISAEGLFPQPLSQQQDQSFGETIRISNVQKNLPAPPRQRSSASIPIAPLTISTLMSETFEGTFPSSEWVLEDYSSGGEYYLGKRDCHPYSGEYAGWSVGAGADGSSLLCGYDYPNYVDTWAIYGPFSLSTAATAQLTFYLYGQTEFESNCSFDGLFVGASSDGISFLGEHYCGYWGNGSEQNQYHRITLDLSNWAGMSDIFVAFNFYSDYSVTYNGFHIDNISLTLDTEPATQVPTTQVPTTPPATATPPPSGGISYLHLPLVIRDYPPQPTPTPIVTSTTTLLPTVGSPTPTAGLQNLVSNGGFERGSVYAEDWLTDGGSRIGFYCRSGSYCMQICSQFANVNRCSPGFYQFITIPNDAVSLSLKFYWRGNTYIDQSTNRMYAKIFDSTTDYFTTSRLYYDGNVGYRMYSYVLNPATVANLRGKTVRLGFFDDKFFQSQIFYIVDDVELTAVR